MHKNKTAQEVIDLIPENLKLWRNYFKDLQADADKFSQKISEKSTAKPSILTEGRAASQPRSFRASEMQQPMKPGTPLRELGQSSRELIDSKSLEASAPQAMLLMNNNVSNIAYKRGSQLMEDIDSGKNSNEKITNAFLAILSRKPTSTELQDFSEILSKSKANGSKNMAWILMNSNEFKFKY